MSLIELRMQGQRHIGENEKKQKKWASGHTFYTQQHSQIVGGREPSVGGGTPLHLSRGTSKRLSTHSSQLSRPVLNTRMRNLSHFR